ncbi:uncharacterized protein LOC130974044 isoform X1 [Arachis stenosperma]|uniref:uncharacterized protein LOC130974044 isoform X1 n=1 Tax=Arachis stenosperma TaxID=217475 RepID=UPI0025AD3100|nr:uncharacterized protein LOC130974044 isoform X1 [Arachis stenosperma]XP_057754760.1 uncharacterized protein LOC130974044 isoform X1 [Arachis stenosperma]XP_057754761.1 uncharacterized protein LOC130974044 isoform X1 [Arachis stenosperma]
MEFVALAVDKTLGFVAQPVFRQLGYIFFYNSNVKNLVQGVEELEAERIAVQHQVDEALRKGDEIEQRVENWLKQASDIISKTEEFQQDGGHKGTRSWLFPNSMRLRYRLGKQAKKMKTDVDGLLPKADFNGASYRLGPRSMDAALSNIGYESFKSRDETMKSVKAALEDPTVRMIGIYGPGGVGKTTLVKEVAKQAMDENLFYPVILTSVTRNPDPKKIQGEIADMLGLRLEEESEIGRADRIRQRLKREKKNTLVILDDLWEGVDLNRLGIPFDDDGFSQMTIKDIPDFDNSMMKNEKATGEYKGCKILLTSRSKEVLSTQMDVKKNTIFSVGILDKKEAEKLFKKVAGVQGKNPKFERLTTEIVRKCGGLPMAIVAVARALTSMGYLDWNNAMDQLKRQEFMGLQNPMEFSVKLSYDHLGSENLKSVFLLCAQMGDRALIMDLMKYCIGLGIFQGVHTIREARNRTDTLLQKLKDSSLLLDTDSNDHFNMHDMIRDVALSIASKEQNVFFLRNGKIDEWPDMDELQRYTAISIHNSEIIDELPEDINCPLLKVFHIDSDDPSLRIPDKIFEGMKNLRILILTGVHLPHLPNSIKCLKNLKMLCLERCQLGENLSIIGELKKLRILSFSGSEIQNLPNELGNLGKLQFFDISNCTKLKGIPPNIISRQSSLEELYMRNSLSQWETEGQTSQTQSAILGELRHMHQLTTLDICISNAELLPTNLFFDKLINYKIVIGDSNMLSLGDFKMPHKYEVSRTLALQLKEPTDIHSQKGIKMLFKRVENLLLSDIYGVQNIFDELNLDGFPELKHLSIVRNSEIEHIIIESIDFSHPHNAFPKLESLCLYELNKMEKLCSAKLTTNCFSNLKSIKISCCGQLKSLFAFCMVQSLTKLEAIDVAECCSLEEIVGGGTDESNDNSVKVNRLKLPALRSLTLRSLPRLTGFLTNDNIYSEPQLVEEQVSDGGFNEITVVEESASHYLLNDQVAIPNLESLELLSINIHKIWSEQSPSLPLTHFCFQKLIKLNVKDCNRMAYLFTYSMATSLPNLKALSASGCKRMQEIFIYDNSNKDETKQISIFPKLEEIQFSSMERLTKIWPSRVTSKSFGSLTTVVIEKCKNLVTVFPGHTVGRFQKLISLKVFDCESVKEIFDIQNSTPQGLSGYETYLQFFYIKELPSLKILWNKDPEGILSIKNLQILEVYGCRNLKYLFPFSVAKDLDKLQCLTVLNCNEMEEIIPMGKKSTASSTLKLPQLSFLQLQQLPKLKNFFGGGAIGLPELKQLAVCYCENLEAQPIFGDEKVISKLEMLTMTMTQKGSEWLNQWISKCRMNSLKDLRLALLQNIKILYEFLHKIPNLEDLTLYSCQFKEVLPHGSLAAPKKIGTVVQVKGLVLWDLPDLQKIGFERDPVFQMIERLRVHRCPRLIDIVPASVSFTYLTLLEVSECNSLINLMAFSTAKSLFQLTTMKIIKCNKMEEIVRKDGTEEETEDVVFSKLMTLEIASLEKLKSFCCSRNCSFKFPSLEKLILRECPSMKVFSAGATSTPKLLKVQVAEEKEKWRWIGDLNGTIGNIFTEAFATGVEHLKLSDQSMLEEIWKGQVTVPNKWFNNLKSLVIKKCKFLSIVIPSNLLPFLSKLEELEVQDCNSVKVIYDMKDVTEETRSMKNMGQVLPCPFPLKKFILKELPNLEHVWNRDPQGIVSLKNLQDVHVERCKSLRSIFPESVAKDLAQLENIVVRYCEEMVEMIARDGESSSEATKEFVFPSLSSLILWQLPKLKWFPRELKIKFPQLKSLDVHHCLLTSALEIYQTACLEDHASTSVAKVFPNFERLSLNKEETMMICHGRQLEVNLLQKLKCLILQCFHSRCSMFPYGFLQKFPHIEEVEVRCCYFKKIFSMDRPDMNYGGVPSKLKQLKLNTMPELNSIGFEHSLADSILKNLEKLEVSGCPRLVNLTPSTVFFSKLAELTVSQCHELDYLLTYSTAKSMHMLEKISISHCQSLKVVVAREIDELDENEHHEIIFEKLKALYLDSLTNLACFYDGISSLNFPLLEQVSVFECPMMESFCQGNAVSPNLSGVKFHGHMSKLKLFGVEYEDHADSHWGTDLKTIISEAFKETAAEFLSHVNHLKLGDHSELKLKDIWFGVVQVPDTCFNNLKSLILENCRFISNVIPSNLLSFLSSLEELEVRNCELVNVIFDVKDITGDKSNMNIGQAAPLQLALKKLKLENLPNLMHVWSKDPHGLFRLPALQVMHVNGCSSIKSLFPVSVAQDLLNLEIIDVSYCGSLEELFQPDIGAEEGITIKFLFPCLTVLILGNLQNFKYIYPGKYEVEFHMLKSLKVYLCKKFTPIFRIDHQKHPDYEHHQNHPDGEFQEFQDNQQALLSIEQVAASLEQLSLNTEDIVMIDQSISQFDLLNKLKALELQCFEYESTFPFGLLQKLPNTEKLQVSHSSFKMIFPPEAGPWLSSCIDDTSYNHEDHSNFLSFTDQIRYVLAALQHTGIRPIDNEHDAKALVPKLKELYLNALPELRAIGLENTWVDVLSRGLKTLEICRCPSLVNLAPSTVLFSSLTNLTVKECGGLQYLFTLSTAKSMHLLENMCICQCESMTEIVDKEEDESDLQVDITLGRLNTLYLDSLENLVSFYAGNSILKFPSLEQVSVFECPKMKVFCQSGVDTPKLMGVEFSNHMDEPCWFGDLNITTWKQSEQMITKFACEVQHLELSEHPELQMFWNNVVSVPDTCFENLESLVVESCEWSSTAIPSNIHSLLSSLKELQVGNCNCVNAIFDGRDIRGDRRMKDLEPALFLSRMILNQLPNLEHIWNTGLQGVAGQQQSEEVYIDGCDKLRSLFPASIEKYLMKLEKLDVKRCLRLEEIVGRDKVSTGAIMECILPAVSFSSLKELCLSDCPRLIYVFSSSTAKSLVQLEKMHINKCKSIKEIVAKEVNDAIQRQIIFGQLKVLSLNSLPSLASFYEGNSTLKFPELVEAIIYECPKMKIFSPGLETPKLEAIQISPQASDKRWEHDLNHTIKAFIAWKVTKFACEVQFLKLIDHPELEDIFCGVALAPFESYFSNLKILVVEGCEFLSSVIHFKLFPFLNNLEELQVRHCDSVKEIFDVEGLMNNVVPSASQSFPRIKKLTLENLPDLQHILRITDHQGIFTFPDLEKVEVRECKSLISLFPAKIAKGLVKLEMLHVIHCAGLVEIAAKDEAATEAENELFEFPNLKWVILLELPELRHFYPGPHNKECPKLKELDVSCCRNPKIFSTAQDFGENYQLFSWAKRLIAWVK